MKTWDCAKWGALCALAAALCGCIFEQLAWSPEGRLLFFANGQPGRLTVWDQQTARLSALDLPTTRSVQACHSLGGGALALLTDVKDSADMTLCVASLSDPRGTFATVDQNVGMRFAAAPDGAIYYIRKSKTDAAQDGVWRAAGGKRELLWPAGEEEPGFPALSPDGARLAMSVGSALRILDLRTRSCQRLTPPRGAGDNNYYWPLWVDSFRLLYIEQTRDELGDLWLLDLQNGAARKLMKNVSVNFGPSLQGPRPLLAISALPGATPRKGQKPAAPRQIALLDLRAGSTDWLTHETGDADNPALSPDGGRLAYLTDVKQQRVPQLRVLDIGAPQPRLIWGSGE